MQQDYIDIVNKILETSIKLRKSIVETLGNIIVETSLTLARSLQAGHKILIFGNGGSAADAQHFAAELVGRFYKLERRALPALALTTNTSTITALSNDYNYSIVFSRQLEAYSQKGDVVVGISTSGNAESVLKGFEKAFEVGAKTIFLTGSTGGKIMEKLGSKINHCIKIPSDNTGRIQEVHITIIHILCELIEYELFQKK